MFDRPPCEVTGADQLVSQRYLLLKPTGVACLHFAQVQFVRPRHLWMPFAITRKDFFRKLRMRMKYEQDLPPRTQLRIAEALEGIPTVEKQIGATVHSPPQRLPA